jgi:hypothetical protein
MSHTFRKRPPLTKTVLTVILQGIAYQEAGQLPTTTAAGDFPEPTTFTDP